MQNMNIANIANGALVEQADIEIQRVIENIMDPNTNTEIKRKVTIVLEFKADDKREVSEVKFTTKSQLAPQKAITTRIAFDRNRNGNIITEELKKDMMRGQVHMNSDGEIVEPKIISNAGTTSMSRIVNIK